MKFAVLEQPNDVSFIADVAPICSCFTKKKENEAVKSLWKLRIGAVVSLSFYAEKVEDHSVAKFVGQEKEEEIFFLVLVSDYT